MHNHDKFCNVRNMSTLTLEPGKLFLLLIFDNSHCLIGLNGLKWNALIEFKWTFDRLIDGWKFHID